MAPELAGSASFGFGAQLGENPFAVGEVGGGKEGTCLPTGCFASLYRGMRWEWRTVPLAHSPGHLQTRGRGGGVAFFPTVRPLRSIRAQCNRDQTRQVNCQPSARHRINGNDFITSGPNPQGPGLNPILRWRVRLRTQFLWEGAVDLESHPPYLCTQPD